MADSKQQELHEIGELCDDLVELVDEGQRDEAIATAEQIIQRVRQYFGATGT